MRLSEGVQVFWLGSAAAILLAALFFEYGSEIISDTAKGSNESPILNVLHMQKMRFARQLLMTTFFASLIYTVFLNEMNYLGLMLLIFCLIVYPASLALNTLYENFFELLNPLSLIGFIRITGKDYLAVSFSFALLSVSFYFMASTSLLSFSIFLPFGLYAMLVFFRLLGLVVFKHRLKLVPEPPANEDDLRIEQLYDDNEKMHEILEGAYWQIKEKQVDEAIRIIAPIIQLGNWSRFDSVFTYISEWPNKIPSLYFIPLYIPHLLANNNAMRALELCEWGLKHDSAFFLDSKELVEQLVSACVSPAQFVVAVKLLDNFVIQYPDHPSAKLLLFRAADICQSRLKHGEKFRELTEKIDLLESPPV